VQYFFVKRTLHSASYVNRYKDCGVRTKVSRSTSVVPPTQNPVFHYFHVWKSKVIDFTDTTLYWKTPLQGQLCLKDLMARTLLAAKA